MRGAATVVSGVAAPVVEGLRRLAVYPSGCMWQQAVATRDGACRGTVGIPKGLLSTIGDAAGYVQYTHLCQFSWRLGPSRGAALRGTPRTHLRPAARLFSRHALSSCRRPLLAAALPRPIPGACSASEPSPRLQQSSGTRIRRTRESSFCYRPRQTRTHRRKTRLCHMRTLRMAECVATSWWPTVRQIGTASVLQTPRRTPRLSTLPALLLRSLPPSTRASMSRAPVPATMEWLGARWLDRDQLAARCVTCLLRALRLASVTFSSRGPQRRCQHR